MRDQTSPSVSNCLLRRSQLEVNDTQSSAILNEIQRVTSTIDVFHLGDTRSIDAGNNIDFRSKSYCIEELLYFEIRQKFPKSSRTFLRESFKLIDGAERGEE